MLKTIRVLLFATFIILGITSCSSPLAGITPVPSLINTPLPPAITPTQSQATATEIQLPAESDYCSSLGILLPISDAQGLNEDEVIRKLMDLWLLYLQAPEAPDWCRIDSYQIEEVIYDEKLLDLPLEPKGDFLRKVLFLVKPIQAPSLWDAWPGETDRQNWLHIQAYVAVFRSDSGYTMKFARP